MKIELNSDNYIYVKGHVSRLNVYAGGKAMNITIAVRRPDSENDNFVNLKSFTPAEFNNLTVGMAVEVWGEIGSASWKDAEGQVHYNKNNDLIAKYIEYNETKNTTMCREAMKAYE